MIDSMVEFHTLFNGDDDQAYDWFRQAVANVSGCSAYERLVSFAALNGADHCEHEGGGDPCDNVIGCTDVD